MSYAPQNRGRRRRPMIYMAKRASEVTPGIVFGERIPQWFKFYSEKLIELFGLQEFSFQVKFSDIRGANRFLRKYGYATIKPGDASAVMHVDTEYLFAVLYFIRPVKLSSLALRRIAHEFLHVASDVRTFSRVKKELTDHYIAPDHQNKVYHILLSIEETTIEHTLNFLERLGLFDTEPLKNKMKKVEKIS